MPKYETQSRHQTLPAAFRPVEPDPELEFLIGKHCELNRRGAPRAVIRGAINERTGVRCFVLLASSSCWVSLDEIDLLEDQPTWEPVDVFG